MTDSSGKRPPCSHDSSDDSSDVNSPNSFPAADPADLQVTLTLPAAIVSAMQQASQQPIDQQILRLLQQEMGLCPESNPQQGTAHPSTSQPSNPLLSPTPLSPPDASLQQHASLQQEVEQLKHRLSLLEALLPRMEAIEGKVDCFLNDQATLTQKASHSSFPIALPNPAAELQKTEVPPTAGKTHEKGDNPGSAVASIWMQVQQNDRPPASVPSTLQPEACPKCQDRLMPFKSSGRIVCLQCGWTDKPQGETAKAEPEIDPEIHRLLEKAAIESMENMKSRKRLI